MKMLHNYNSSIYEIVTSINNDSVSCVKELYFIAAFDPHRVELESRSGHNSVHFRKLSGELMLLWPRPICMLALYQKNCPIVLHNKMSLHIFL
jgi:hypothetical protein